MFFIDFFKNLFSKKPINNNDEIITDEGFEKWNDIKNVSPTFIYMLLNESNLNDIASALVHTDKITLNHILNCASTLRKKEELLKLIQQYSNLTINQSNKMKSHIMNNLLNQEYTKYIKGTKGTGSGGLYFG